MNNHWIVPYKICVCCVNQNSKMVATVGVVVTCESIGKKYVFKLFYPETTELFESKFGQNILWMNLYNICMFVSNGNPSWQP